MDPYELILFIPLAIVALLCRHDRRALLWLSVGAAEFVVTTVYARHPFVYFLLPPLFAGLCDSAIAALILTRWRRQWERALAALFIVMALVNMGYLLFGGRETYVIALEVLNWLAIFVIGGPKIMELAGEHTTETHVGMHPRGAVRGLNRLAHSERKGEAGPFTAIRKG